MKTIIYSILICLASGSAFSKTQCYEFDVKKHSNGIEKIEVRVNDSEKKKFTSEIFASKSTAKWTLTSFDCQKSKEVLTCTQAAGGGDFSLKVKGSDATLSLTYVNLAIGSKGPVATDDKSEINEEFALLDVANSEETDKDDESGELEEISIAGKESICQQKP